MSERKRVLRPKVAGPEAWASGDLPDANQIESITVHYGEEAYSPVQYNTFRVGGHSVTVVPRVGETARDAAERGLRMLEEIADKEFEHRLVRFRNRLNRSKGE